MPDATLPSNSDLAAYLLPSSGVDSDSEGVLELAERLTRGAQGPAETAARLFAFVRDTIRYVPYAPFDSLPAYTGQATLERGYGFCTQKSALLIALSRAAGVPARFHYADLVNHSLPERLEWVLGCNRMVYHTYVEFLLEGRWIKATPSFEKPLCEKMGWRLVEFDGTSDAILHRTDLSGRLHVEYAADRGTDAGVPLSLMLDAWMREYGPETLGRWQEAVAGKGLGGNGGRA